MVNYRGTCESNVKNTIYECDIFPSSCDNDNTMINDKTEKINKIMNLKLFFSHVYFPITNKMWLDISSKLSADSLNDYSMTGVGRTFSHSFPSKCLVNIVATAFVIWVNEYNVERVACW